VSGNHSIDVCLRQHPAAHYDRGNRACVASIGQWVSFDQHQVGPLADFDRALCFSRPRLRLVRPSAGAKVRGSPDRRRVRAPFSGAVV
jgi:hypothetical protein